MKKFLAEFKEFALRGNVMDMAIGVVIGAAFKAIIDALTEYIINPIIGCFIQGGLEGWKVTIGKAELCLGAFIMAIINFIIIFIKAVPVAKAFERGADKGIHSAAVFFRGASCASGTVNESADAVHLQQFILVGRSDVLIDVGQ